MAFHLPAIPLHFIGSVPDLHALAAASVGAALGIAIPLAADRLPPSFAHKPTTSLWHDSFGALLPSDGSSGGWMGEFSERTEATRSSHLIFASLSLAGAAATGGAVHRYGVHVTGVISALFCAALVLLTAMILRQRQIPNLFTTALIWSGLLANLPVIHALFAPIQGAIFGAVVGYLLPWSVAMLACWIGRDVTGPGDFKLCAAAGAWLGVGALPQVFAMSVIVAAISMTLRRVASRHSAEACRVFGPSIAIAAGITMCCGVWLNIPCVTVMGGVL